MPIQLPKTPVEAVKDLTAYNMLIMGEPGIGKSGLLASIPDYLLVDPIYGMKGYPGLKVNLTNWQEHLELVEKLSSAKGAYAGIGLDCLNISYDHCATYVTQQLRIRHPGELAHGTGWQRITTEFINWLRAVILLGYHIVATCHTTIIEVTVRGVRYNRWVPAFVGGGATSTYAHVLKLFDIIGFMTMQDVEEPPTKIVRSKDGRVDRLVDIRADTKDLVVSENRIIRFDHSAYWLAEDISQMLPDKVELTDRWQDDWRLICEAWGTSGKGHELLPDEVQTEGQQLPSDQLSSGPLAAGPGGTK